MNSASRPISAPTIACSDRGGGADIHVGLKTCAVPGVHGSSAIAALNAQNAHAAAAVHMPAVEFLATQIDACFDDFNIGAVEPGTIGVVEAVAGASGRRLGAATVPLESGHLEDDGDALDLCVSARETREIAHPRLGLRAHGTGCAPTSAIAANLRLGRAPLQACTEAADYAYRASLSVGAARTA